MIMCAVENDGFGYILKGWKSMYYIFLKDENVIYDRFLWRKQERINVAYLFLYDRTRVVCFWFVYDKKLKNNDGERT